MQNYRKFLAATAVSIAAAVGVYNADRKSNQELIIQDQVLSKNDKNCQIVDKSYELAIKNSLVAVNRVKNELGLPGIVVGVSVNGSVVWAQGFGLANVETATPCDAETKMRIASISKPITIALLAKLMESGAVDIDKPIQEYVKYFPVKNFNGENVTITTRLLACHKAGIRHYKMDDDANSDGGPEFYLTEKFKNVEKSVDLFKDDDLLFKPGDGFKYTTHGYTLLSAVIEEAVQKPFAKQVRTFLDLLGMTDTHLDEISTLIYGRASYYVRNKKTGRMQNAELADNSYKWAGGGLVSNVQDLLKFANIMLYSFQQGEGEKNGFLKPETVKMLWTIVPGTTMSWSSKAGYGLGWTISPYEPSWFDSSTLNRYHVGHSGGAVGASSIISIYPNNATENAPSGVTVAILTNMQDIGLHKLSKEIAENFVRNGN